MGSIIEIAAKPKHRVVFDKSLEHIWKASLINNIITAIDVKKYESEILKNLMKK